MSRPLPNDIIAAFRRSDMAAAERLSRECLVTSPDDVDLLFGLALALQQQGRDAEAAEPYRRLTELAPAVAAHWTNLATTLRMSGDGAGAVAAAHRAVELDPGSSSCHVVLGQALLAAGDAPAAQEVLLKACELDPASVEAQLNAAGALVLVRDAQAYLLLRNWRTWLPLDPPEQVQLAHLLLTIGEGADAQAVLEDLLRRVPNDLKARLQLVALLERRNDVERAQTLLTDTKAMAPGMDERARREVAHLEATLAMRQGDPKTARALFERNGPRHPLDSAHYFNLAAVDDRLGETAAAMTALESAHRLQAEELTPIAPKAFALDAPILPNSISRLAPDFRQSWLKLVAPNRAQSPVFIIGFPRSGTTLLEQMLDAHPALQSMDERPFFNILSGELEEIGVEIPRDLNRFNQRDCDELRKRYVELVAEKIRRRRDTRLVDKNPLNMLWLPLIVRLFPEAQFILALRHPCDVVLSNYMQNYRSTMLASACSTLERTARAYVAAMASYLYHADLIRPEVFVSRYEDLVADPAAQAQRIAGFLGLVEAAPLLDYDKRAKEKGFIATPSYTEVIRPISAARTERWRRYQREFEPVLPILAPMLERWGYDV